MRVSEVWRFPVKSLQGERLEAARIGPTGVEGDRAYAIFDQATGFGLTARRAPELLFASARLLDDGRVEISLPDGSVAGDDAALSAWLGRSVVLRSTSDEGTRRYENPTDFEHESTAAWDPFDGSTGAFHDEQGAAVSLVSTGSLNGWDTRRFRTNLVLEGAGEQSLVGSVATIGGARLDVGLQIARCVMVTRPQPGGVERDLDVLRTIHRDRGGCLAVGATVASPGMVAVGNQVIDESE